MLATQKVYADEILATLNEQIYPTIDGVDTEIYRGLVYYDAGDALVYSGKPSKPMVVVQLEDESKAQDEKQVITCNNPHTEEKVVFEFKNVDGSPISYRDSHDLIVFKADLTNSWRDNLLHDGKLTIHY